MSKHKLANRLGIICLSLLMLTGGWQPVVLAESVSVYQKLGEYEKTLFGQTESSLPIDKRLGKLEKQLFGKSTKDGTTADRIAAIEKVMNGKSSTYLPPIAPEMDRSEFAPTPQQAPENPAVDANSVDREQDAPLPADTGDRVKGLLRQAMQYYSQGKTSEAERVYRQVLATDFRNADANYNLGAIAESKGDLAGAKRYYAAAHKASPDDQDIAEALKAVDQKLKSQPAGGTTASAGDETGMPVTAADKAIAEQAAEAYKKGNFDEAIQKLGYLARKNPYDASTQFALGQAFRGKGNNAEAIKHLRSAASLDPRNDMYVKALNDEQSQTENSQTASASGAGTGSAGSSDVTPFVGLPSSDNSLASGGGDMSAVDDYLRRNGGGGGMMMGSVTGYGSSMGGGFGSMGGFPVMLGTASGSTRLRRIMTSSLAGAAMGAMTNRGYPGGMSRGAMRGAMYGGLFGLMMGGF